MSSKKETPPFRLNLANAAARKVDPEDPRLARLIEDAEAPLPSPVPLAVAPSAPLPNTPPVATTPASAIPSVGRSGQSRGESGRIEPGRGEPYRGERGSHNGGAVTIPAAPPTPAPRRTRRASAPTVRISVAVDGPLPWEVLGELADTQRNMNLRLTETDLQKLQWLAQCLPGTSIQKICRDAIRGYVDARIHELVPRDR